MKILSVIAMVAGLAVSAASQTFRAPTGRVDNVRFERVAGGVINIYYDLTSDDPSAIYSILLDVSLDGGQTFALRPRTITGDVGLNVAAGMGKKIVWDAGKDVETVQIELFRIRVTPERGALRPVPAARGALTVVTVPAGAAVFVDGTSRGQSPVTVADLSVGSHQVGLVKSGYLENRASVEIKAGETQQLTRTLTEMASPVTPVQRASGGRPKWLIPAIVGGGVAAAAGAKAAGSTATPAPVTPPVIGSFTVGTQADGFASGIDSVTNFIYNATVAGASDTISFSLDFGDGTPPATGSCVGCSGTPARHVYTRSATFQAIYKVSNAGGAPTLSVPVQTTTVNGTWAWSSFTFTFVQNSSSVSGTWRRSDVTGAGSSGTFVGALTDPRNLRMTVSSPGFSDLIFVGSSNPNVTIMSGVASGFSRGDESFVLLRQ